MLAQLQITERLKADWESSRPQLEAEFADVLMGARERGLEEAAVILKASGVSDDASQQILAKHEAELRKETEQRSRLLIDFWAPLVSPNPVQVSELPPERSSLPVLLLGTFAIVLIFFLDHGRHTRRPLLRMEQTLRERGQGAEPSITPMDPMLRGLSDALGEARAEVQLARSELEETVVRKTSALAEALQEQREMTVRLERVFRELETAQEQLVEQRKMAALGTLAGGVAHEFHNILGGIGGCASDLLQDAHDGDSRQTLEVIVRAADRGREIVDGLRRFSGDSLSRPITPGDARAVAEEAQRLCQHAAASAGVEVLVIGEEGILIQDSLGLHQVILNLLKNAVTASPRGSTVEVRLRAENGRLILTVEDDGPGVPEALRGRIFEPFFTTRQSEGGTGLGLAISHGILAQQGGSLSYKPRERGGSVFRVEMSLAEGESHHG